MKKDIATTPHATIKAQDRYENIRDLEPVELSETDGKLVRQLRDPYSFGVRGPLGVSAMCFDAAGAPAATMSTYAAPDAPDEIEVGGLASFTLDVPDACASYVVGGSGFTR